MLQSRHTLGVLPFEGEQVEHAKQMHVRQRRLAPKFVEGAHRPMQHCCELPMAAELCKPWHASQPYPCRCIPQCLEIHARTLLCTCIPHARSLTADNHQGTCLLLLLCRFARTCQKEPEILQQ